MASISSIDIDQNLSKCNVCYISENNLLNSLNKKKVLHTSLCLFIVVTFILACRGVSSSNDNSGMLAELNKAVNSVSNARTELEKMAKDNEISSNKLAMPKTKKENNFLKQVNNLTEGSAVHPDIWIGGSDIEEEGVWKWVDGTTIPQTLQNDNWALGEPNNAYGGTQHCLAKYFRGDRAPRNSRTDRFWDDAVCEAKKQFICSFDPQFDCPRGWMKYEESCYYVSGIMAPWNEARNYCKREQNSSDLVEFTSLDEVNFVKGLIVERSKYEEMIWVGASDLKSEGDWRWVKGGTIITSFWNSGEPNNIGGEHCAMINKKRMMMNDSKCSKKFLFVCEMASSEEGFVPVLTLGDHLGNIEKEIKELKVNITDMSEVVKSLQTSPVLSNKKMF